MALTWQLQGRIQEAIASYREALRLEPEYAEAHNNLGRALKDVGRNEDALAHANRALRLKPDYADAHYNLGTVLQRLGRIEEAIAHYRDVLRIQPDYVEAHLDLAWLWATVPDPNIRDGQRALKHAQLAARPAGEENPSVLETLAAAYAELGKFDEAVLWQEKAIQMTPDGQQDVVRARLELYKQGKPCRENPTKDSNRSSPRIAGD